MAILKDPKLEKFLHNIVKGMDGGPAWTAAGFKATGNAAESAASRSLRRESMKARYMELMAPAVYGVTDLRDLARQYTGEAVETLRSVMKDKLAPYSARVAAATAVLDRGHGKPPQAVEAKIDGELVISWLK